MGCIRQRVVVRLFTGLPTANSIECVETSRSLASHDSGEPIGVSRRVTLTRVLTRNLLGTPTRGLTPRGSPERGSPGGRTTEIAGPSRWHKIQWRRHERTPPPMGEYTHALSPGDPGTVLKDKSW
jgi:hypothetical protein